MVPGGTVGRGLLRDDPLAPFGWRLDHAKVLSAFEEEWAWPGESVVLVEASDLSRAAAYGGRSTPRQARALRDEARSEEHTSELQSLMRISYAVFCLKKKTKQ